jgi:hypothetical protein
MAAILGATYPDLYAAVSGQPSAFWLTAES